MKQLTFDTEYEYTDHPDGIRLPVQISYGANSLRLMAKVDCGAEVCLFSNENGRKLGVAVEQGISIVLDTLGGPIEAFGHEVTLRTGELVFNSLVYFAKYPGLARNILGRQGWLRNLRMAVIDYDNLLYLNSYE